MIKIIKKNKTTNGYALLELLFYLSLFSILTIVVINSMITMTRSFRETALQAEFMQSGTMLERISREIRGSYGINLVSASDLVLNTKDNNGVNKTVEFLLSGSNLRLLENGALIGNLNMPNTVVTALTFTEIITAKGKAVKISFTIRSLNDSLGRTQNFYNTVVLRGGY